MANRNTGRVNSNVGKGADNTSDGIAPQMQPDIRQKTKKQPMFANFPFDSLIFQQLKVQERFRNFDLSYSDGIEDEYNVPWHVSREHSRDPFDSQTQEGRSQVSAHFSEVENKLRWNRLKESREAIAINGNCSTRRS